MNQVANTVMIPREEYDALVQQRDALQDENTRLQMQLHNRAIDPPEAAALYQLEAVKQQRDELLAAAQPALEAVEAALGWVSDPEIAKRYRQCGINLRAAIAKVKP